MEMRLDEATSKKDHFKRNSFDVNMLPCATPSLESYKFLRDCHVRCSLLRMSVLLAMTEWAGSYNMVCEPSFTYFELSMQTEIPMSEDLDHEKTYCA